MFDAGNGSGPLCGGPLRLLPSQHIDHVSDTDDGVCRRAREDVLVARLKRLVLLPLGAFLHIELPRGVADMDTLCERRRQWVGRCMNAAGQEPATQYQPNKKRQTQAFWIMRRWLKLFKKSCHMMGNPVAHGENSSTV